MSDTMSAQDTSEMVETGPLWRQSQHGTKGRGLSAAITIKRGTRILEEAPLLRLVVGRVELFDEDAFYGAGNYSGGPAVLEALHNASYASQAKYNQLTYEEKTQETLNNSGRDPARGVLTMEQWQCLSRLQRNAFDASPDEGDQFGCGEKVLVVFHHISFINHSCQPNAVWVWNPQRGVGTVHALRDITKGNQIYVSYISTLEDTLKPRAERKRLLLDSWGFDCTCAVCHGGSDDGLRRKAWRDWQALNRLPWPNDAVPMSDAHLATLTWPDDHEDISTEEDVDVVCKSLDTTALHREHRRIIAYHDSITDQFKALQLNDPVIYHRRAAYHYEWSLRRPASTGRDYEDCENCGLVTHTRRHLQYALDACNAEFELDLVRYGVDHPVVEETIRRSAAIREKKAQYHSPKLR